LKVANLRQVLGTLLDHRVISRRRSKRSLSGRSNADTRRSISSGSLGFEGFDYLGDMSAPSMQGLVSLGQEFVALIDAATPEIVPDW